MGSPARDRGYKKPRHLQRQKTPGHTEPQDETSHHDAPPPPPEQQSSSDGGHESETEGFGLPNLNNFVNSNLSLDFIFSDFRNTK